MKIMKTLNCHDNDYVSDMGHAHDYDDNDDYDYDHENDDDDEKFCSQQNGRRLLS